MSKPPLARRRRSAALLLGLLVLALGLLAVAIAGRAGSPVARPPAIRIAAPTPAAAAPPVSALAPAAPPVSAPVPAPLGPSAAARVPSAAAIVAVRPREEQLRDLSRFRRRAPIHVPARWVAGFYRLYDVAGRTFAVNWLLIASIHRQETSFSTEPDTYHGLNFAKCCGGPMQFNVTNGPITTWARVSDSFQYAVRPDGYPNPTLDHPSIYDDFDAVMAAGRLLATDGATLALDAGSWQAAYAYYGHDPTGVTYADQVIARAISWSQGGFCINCGLDQAMVAAVHAAYGAPVLAALRTTAAGAAAAAAARRVRRSG